MLAQAKLVCRELGLWEVLVTCAEDNLGSRRVIEANGGEVVFEEYYPLDQIDFIVGTFSKSLAGVGGGNFASSMANINAFYPDRLKGWALGVNAGRLGFLCLGDHGGEQLGDAGAVGEVGDLESEFDGHAFT